MDKWYPNRAKRYTHLCAYHPEDYSQPIDSIPNETDIVNFKKLLISEGISEDDILDE
ncbi:hypothetical protein FACS1894166_09890 [Bacilli bacterium]|nr:hypothetical protein FACS1894166_09890 [Bacilli bacterium]